MKMAKILSTSAMVILSCMMLNSISTSNAKTISSEPITDGDDIYYVYPNGVLPSNVTTPSYRIADNDGSYPKQFSKVAFLHGSWPNVNTPLIMNEFHIPEFIEANGSFYPVCGIDAAFSSAVTKKLTIHDNINVIGQGCFYQARQLETLTLPASLSQIGADAFTDMPALKSVYFRSVLPPVCEVRLSNGSVKKVSIQDKPIDETVQINRLFTGSNPTIFVPKGSMWFYRQHPCFATLRIVEYTPEYELPEFTGESKTLAADQIYGYAGNLTLSVLTCSGAYMQLIPKSLQSNGYQLAISMEENPYTIRYIAGQACRDKSWVSTVSIPPTVLAIGSQAFEKTELPTVSLPSGLKYIGEKAFASNSKLSRLILYRNQEDPFLMCSPDAFEESAGNAILYVNPDLIDVSQAPWNQFKEIRDIKELE